MSGHRSDQDCTPEILAHVDQSGRHHLLADHLRETARLAREFAEKFASGAAAELTALAHDLGKTQSAFQDRLRGNPHRVRHAYVGAAELFNHNDVSCLLAAAVSGHHSGLPNFMEFAQDIRADLNEARCHLKRARSFGFPQIFPLQIKPHFLTHDEITYEFWLRMIFSTLVDADYLDTERFFNEEKFDLRAGTLRLEDMKLQLDEYLLTKTGEAVLTPLNQLRRRVLNECRAAALQPPGLFSLTVPTGGGKTLSAMSFALDHAVRHNLNRVIVVIPFTSIIEQNAQVYRDVFGDDAVIEHHSIARVETDETREIPPRSSLAAENWDASLVVTTSVQFFESLFANQPGRCRKLHNIARSVVILDEVQTLPAKLLSTIVDGLGELVRNYGTSIVLSTATQPALRCRTDFPLGLTGIREIISDPASLFTATASRTHVSWPADPQTPMSWESLADRLADEPSVLCVVHRRDDAQRLTGLLDERVGDEKTIHLSATMCAEQRLEKIREIRTLLQDDVTLRVVSTQLVEAGVDLDFPVVYRALGGLDSIAQAGGRCNREGRLAGGRVEVFVAMSAPPMGIPVKALEVTKGLLAARGALDIHDPTLYDEYFKRLYNLTDHDAKDIQKKRAKLAFKDVAAAFRMIEDDWSESIIVPYGRGAQLLADLDRRLASGLPISWRLELRKLQRFTVQIAHQTADDWRAHGYLLPLGENIAWVLSSDVFHVVYSPRFGLPTDGGETWLVPLLA